MHKVWIRGSHGTLHVDRRTGIVIEYDRDCHCGEDYDTIARFETVVFERNADVDDFDILECGYWLQDGSYAEPLSWCQIDDDWVDWQPFRLLPAPAHV